ncbi:MAG: T9SS type A sorting domain-containing protein [Bacteroidota bacterium]
MKNIFPFAILALFLTLSKNISAQDVWLQNHFSPSGGCQLSNAETVNVLVNNNSGVVMPSNTITVSYTVNGGSVVSQFLSSNLFPGASWSFSFSVKADLSACGAHTLKVWVTRPGDVNQLNDTLKWIVNNDCVIVPGKISGDTNVCEGKNNGVLSLKGNKNGTISGWQSSVDSGKTWTAINNTTNALSYSDIKTHIKYRVLIDGGFCPDDIPDSADLIVVQWRRGSLFKSDSLYAPASGSIYLKGATHPVVLWESLDTITNVWDTIQQTDTVLSFSNLNATTKYRATTGGGVCPETLTDTATVTILYHNVGVKGLKVANSMLYPNPVNNVLTVRLNGGIKAQVSILNSLGQIVLETSVNEHHSDIDVSKLPQGVYVFQVFINGTQAETLQFIKL